MYIEKVPNRKSRPCILLRECFRQDGKVRKRTLANLTDWPEHIVAGLKTLIKSKTVASTDATNFAAPADFTTTRDFDIVRSLPHGHVAAVLGTLRQLGLERLVHTRRSRQRDLVVAMIVARVIAPLSKLATVRGLHEETDRKSVV